MLRLCKRCPPQPQEVQILRNLLVNGSTKSFGTFRPKILKHLLRWKSEKSIFWGHRARKWGPTVKIRLHSVFAHAFARFFRYLLFTNSSSLKSLFDLKMTHICTLKIFLSRLGLKSTQKSWKINFSQKNRKLQTISFQNPCRSSKST